MKIVVSACLLGENCKYNGGNNRCEAVLDFVKNHEVIAVCPEQMGGLSTPRQPAELVNGVATSVDGICVDNAFRKGAQMAADLALKEGAEMAILQPRSPSCGSKQIYDGTFSKRLISGQGVFARMLSELNIRTLEPEDLPSEDLERT